MNSNKYALSMYFCFVLLSFFSTIAEYVPVYMWEKSKIGVSVPALDRISEDSFKDLLLERLEKNPLVVVFAEHNLSPEDFIQRDNAGKIAYPNLSALKITSKISYWPFVQSPIKAIKQLEKEVSEVSITKLSDSFNVPKNRILIVDLNDAGDYEDRYEMLKRHDFTIASIYEKLLESNGDVLALYTAHHTSWVIPEDVRSHRRVRNLLAESNETGTTLGPKLFNETHALVYLNSSAFYMNETIKVDLLSYTASTSINENETIYINFTLTERDPTFKFIIKQDSGYWYLKNITVTEPSNGKESKEYHLNVKDVYAPYKFSYHCTKTVFYGKNSTQNLTLPGFQIQPLLAGNYTPFGDAYDCVGFTSAPIWSGIFVTFILVLIMTVGLTMMMDIKTMDRFDDPKGKTITINVSE